MHVLRSCFGKVSRRIKSLPSAKISLSNELTPVFKEPYQELKQRAVKEGNFELMAFDRLCALPAELFEFLELEVRKDKFNVPDKEFLLEESQPPKLNAYYQRIYALLSNHNEHYDELRGPLDTTQAQMAEMCLMELEKDPELASRIEWFLDNLLEPAKLESVAEPSLVKYILALKRELIMQGITFPFFARSKLEKYKAKGVQYVREDLIILRPLLQYEIRHLVEEPSDAQVPLIQASPSIPEPINTRKVKIVKVLGYEYEFWVDVKPNRTRNRESEKFYIEDQEIENKNPFCPIRTVRVKYIVRKEKRNGFKMHFVMKATVVARLANEFDRIVKVEWNGPGQEQSGVGYSRDYRIIDYEGLMRGNPTIRPLFMF